MIGVLISGVLLLAYLLINRSAKAKAFLSEAWEFIKYLGQWIILILIIAGIFGLVAFFWWIDHIRFNF